MAHTTDPSDPNSSASTFAPDQPGRGVVADDKEAPEGRETASEATKADADRKAGAVTSSGPDRAPHGDPLHEVIPKMSDDDKLAAEQSDNAPKAAPKPEARPGEKRASAPVGSGSKGSSGKS